MKLRFSVRSGLIAALLVLWALAGGAAAQMSQSDTDALIRRVIDKELKVAANPNASGYMFTLRREADNKVVVRDYVPTNKMLVGRLLTVNGKPATPEQRRKEDAKLDKLVHDPVAQQERIKEQKEDAERVQRIIGGMPDALIFTLEGAEQGQAGEMYRFSFKPRGGYNPPHRELIVLTGLEGKVWIDKSDERLVKMDAKLVRDVTLGWGLLARLHKGGTILLTQAQLPDGAWQTTEMVLNFDGRALLFKSVNIKQRQVRSNFRRVPQGLSVAQGIDLLRKQETVTANQSGG